MEILTQNPKTPKPQNPKTPKPLRVELVVIVTVSQSLEDHSLAGLHHLTTNDHLIQDLVHFVKVEHKVEFADIAKVLIQNFDEQMDKLKDSQLIVHIVDAQSEVQ